MNIIEELRKESIDDLFKTETVTSCWQEWGRKIRVIIGDNPNENNILDLGDHLAEIFKSTKSEDATETRSQSSLSGGGTAWEALITWYINLCTSGTRVVAIKKKSILPSPIHDSITVNYANYGCSSESDITIIVFPDNTIYTADNTFLNLKGKVDRKRLDDAIAKDFSSFEVGIIQCKTNWNDNAQIPMLWDMIYSAGGFRGRNITVGKNGFSIQALPLFTYSFVTVPTNKLSSYKTTSTSVGRVKNLSGGNYWGLPTYNGIARSVKEIFTNYESGYNNKNIRITLQSLVNQLNTKYSYFNLP